MKMRSGRNYGRRFAPYVVSAMRRRSVGTQTPGNRVRRIQNRSARYKIISAGRGITTQHDSKRMYSRRNMPRYKKRQWKRFVKKVQFVNERDMGSRTVLLSNQLSVTDGDSSHQSVVSLALYPQKSTVYHLNDLNYIMGFENAGNPTAAAGVTVDNQSRVFFQSAVLDLTIRNTSKLVGSTTNVLDYRAQLELDIYECYSRQDFTVTGANYQSLYGAIAGETANEKVIGGNIAPLFINSRGATPWECCSALSRLGVKILKKTKYFVPNNSTVTYQMRDPRRHSNLVRELIGEEGANKTKWTKWVLVIYKLVPGLTKGTIYNPLYDQFTEAVDIGITRKYLYKIEGVSENRHYYGSGAQTFALGVV